MHNLIKRRIIADSKILKVPNKGLDARTIAFGVRFTLLMDETRMYTLHESKSRESLTDEKYAILFPY